MTANPADAISGDRSLAEIVSSVPPVPPTVLATVASTDYGRRFFDWTTKGYNTPQVITALVLIEQSPAGRAWGVKIEAIPNTVNRVTDARYSTGCAPESYLGYAQTYVEWFFVRSKLSENAPVANVNWSWKVSENPTLYASTGISFSCDAVCRMLYAAQELIDMPSSRELKLLSRMDTMENKITKLEAEIAALRLELGQARAVSRAPAVTCLMNLFPAFTLLNLTCSSSTCMRDPPVSGGTDGDVSTRSDIDDAHPANPTFNIAPHTDRLSDLSLDAINWLLQQLDTRTVWVHATDPDSEDNHISWTPFHGAVKTDKRVALTHGNYRFW